MTIEDPLAIGYAVFDRPEAPSQGWAARSGDRKARIIGGLHDLATDTVWLTNLEWDEMQRLQIARNAFFRQARYLGQPMGRVLDHLGISDERPQDRALIGATLFSRVMALYAQEFGEHQVPPGRLPKAIRERVAGPDPEVNEIIDQALTDAAEYFDKKREWIDPAEGREVNLRIPPLVFAKAMLTTAVPDEEADPEWVEGRSIPKAVTSDWILSQAPCLAKITIERIGEVSGAQLNFGSTMSPDSRRRWTTHSELARLIESGATVKVHQLAKWPADPARFDVLNNIITRLDSVENGAFRASESIGLFVEALWRGAITQFGPWPRRANTKWHSMTAPFVTALGRMICMTIGLHFEQAGFIVRRQGYGGVTIWLREQDDRAKLAELCIKHSVMPPVFNADDAIPGFTPTSSAGAPTDYLSANIALRIRGESSINKILEVDSALMNWALRMKTDDANERRAHKA